MRVNSLFYTVILLALCNYTHAQNLTIQSLLNDVRLDSLTNFIRQLSGEKPVVINGVIDTIKSRQHQQPGNEKAFQFMKSEFTRFGYDVDSLQFNPTGKNLFAIKPGYQYPGKWFILGAHYDNRPETTLAPGADDNASGTATVLEAARIFKNYTFPYTIVFALWDEEEIGLLGSTAYASSINAENIALMGYVNVDMLGWDGNNDSVADIHVRQVATSTILLNKAQSCNTAYNIQLQLHIVDPGSGATDHAPFWDNGYSAIGIAEEYDNDFNPYWHTQADSLAQFNLNFYQKSSMLAYAVIAELASDTANILSLNNPTSAPFQLYPNPFTGQLTINATTAGIVINKMIVFDYAGHIVYQKQIDNHFAELNMNEILNPGVYFLKIFTSDNSFTKKIIKQ